MTEEEKPKSYRCTECGGDAFVGYTNWIRSGEAPLVKPGERLCLKCFRKRGGLPMSFHA